jgi:predicted amidohydrolase
MGGELRYDGGSAAYDPWGQPVAMRTAVASPSVVDVSTARVAEVRGKYPFLEDIAQSLPTY